MTQLVCPFMFCSCSPILSFFSLGSPGLDRPYTVPDKAAAPDSAAGGMPGPAAAGHTSSLRAAVGQQDAHPAGRHRRAACARLWAWPSSRPSRDEKRVPFSALHPPAQTRSCPPAPRRRTGRRGSFSYFGHTRVSIALFRQSCNLIPAQILSTQSIKYGQKHRRNKPFCPCLK